MIEPKTKLDEWDNQLIHLTKSGEWRKLSEINKIWNERNGNDDDHNFFDYDASYIFEVALGIYCLYLEASGQKICANVFSDITIDSQKPNQKPFPISVEKYYGLTNDCECPEYWYCMLAAVLSKIRHTKVVGLEKIGYVKRG